MRRKPCASHCVKKPPPDGVQARQMGVLLWRAGVADLQCEGLIWQVVEHELAVFDAERHRLAIHQHSGEIEVFAVQAQRRPGLAGVALRVILLMTRVLAGSRSNVRSTVLIQKAGAAYSSRRINVEVPSRIAVLRAVFTEMRFRYLA